MTTNLLSVIEQQQKALEHCVDAIVERGLNGSQEQARKWGLQLPLERAYAALAAGQQALEQTQGEQEVRVGNWLLHGPNTWSAEPARADGEPITRAERAVSAFESPVDGKYMAKWSLDFYSPYGLDESEDNIVAAVLAAMNQRAGK